MIDAGDQEHGCRLYKMLTARAEEFWRLVKANRTNKGLRLCDRDPGPPTALRDEKIRDGVPNFRI